VGEPEALNTQAHSEQPKPQKRFSSIHTSLRSNRILGSVCDTSHSPRENFLGEVTGTGRNEPDIDSAVMLPTDRAQESVASLEVGLGHIVVFTHAMYFVTLLLS
jgi:hypothetical protein